MRENKNHAEKEIKWSAWNFEQGINDIMMCKLLGLAVMSLATICSFIGM